MPTKIEEAVARAITERYMNLSTSPYISPQLCRKINDIWTDALPLAQAAIAAYEKAKESK